MVNTIIILVLFHHSCVIVEISAMCQKTHTNYNDEFSYLLDY